jgi:hypothetical protein
MCNMPDDEHVMMLCDACGSAYHTYCLTPPLEKVPAGEWVCPSCQKAGISVREVLQTRAGRTATVKRNTDNLFPDAEKKAKIQLAKAFDGCLIPQKSATKRGGIKHQYGVLAYRGAGAKPEFLVRYDDDTEELLTLRAVTLRKPLPRGSRRPEPAAQPVTCTCHGKAHAAHYLLDAVLL